MAIRTGPLGYSFTLARLLQFTALVIICGVTANLGVTVNRLDAPKIPVELLVAIIVVSLPSLGWEDGIKDGKKMRAKANER